MNPVSKLDAATDDALNLVGNPANSEIARRIDANLADIRQDNVFRLGPIPADVTARHEELVRLRATVGDLIEAIEEKADLRSGEEGTDLGLRFAEIAIELGPYAVARRAEKEARVMGAAVQALPSMEAATTEATERRVIARLEANTARCDCGRRMKLREGNNHHFWGCSFYPTCTGTRQLTARERAILKGEA